MADPFAQLAAALAEQYTIEREAGVGGMATVYVARDLKHDRHVALKVLRPDLAALLGVERFLSEIRVTAHLHHPHILPLFDSGQAGGLVYYVMPHVEGESLRQWLARERQLPVATAIEIGRAVAGALDYAHRHGVIHRDIKPENILFQDGQAVVADFGIALALSAAAGARLGWARRAWSSHPGHSPCSRSAPLRGGGCGRHPGPRRLQSSGSRFRSGSGSNPSTSPGRRSLSPPTGPGSSTSGATRSGPGGSFRADSSASSRRCFPVHKGLRNRSSLPTAGRSGSGRTAGCGWSPCRVARSRRSAKHRASKERRGGRAT